MTRELRALWDFGDLDLSERRFRAQLDAEETEAGRAEVLTQLARVEALRGRFAEAEAFVVAAEALAGSTPAVRVRVDLERGRLLRSSGDPAAALSLFESAYTAGLEAGEDFLAADAAHMAALSTTDGGVLAWTRRGIELAERSEAAAYWLGPLQNNLGWWHFEAGRFGEALDAFEGALATRERDPENRVEIEIARYAVGKALRALGRSADAVPLLEQAVGWTETVDEPDAWLHEELAEEYAALGRDADAAVQAMRALALVEPDDPRAARLRELAGGK